MSKKIETKEEIAKRIAEQMQDGEFKLTMEYYTVRQIINLLNNGKLNPNPVYQRNVVWKTEKQRALIESIIRYTGKKVPTLTFRVLNDGTMEIVDGKQRSTALKSFDENKFSLKGVYNEELKGFTINDIEETYNPVYTAFMSTNIPVQVATNMTDDEAVTYYFQINSSGDNLTAGERVRGIMGTPFLKAVQPLADHKVWEHINWVNKNRYTHYEYTARMLLFVLESNFQEKIYCETPSKKLSKEIDKYGSIEFPNSMITRVTKTFDFLEKIFKKEDFKLSIREFYRVFCYAVINIESLTVSDFGKFIKELHYFIHDLDDDELNLFRKIKDNWDDLAWFINTLNSTYLKFIKGEGWNEIKLLSPHK